MWWYFCNYYEEKIRTFTDRNKLVSSSGRYVAMLPRGKSAYNSAYRYKLIRVVTHWLHETFIYLFNIHFFHRIMKWALLETLKRWDKWYSYWRTKVLIYIMYFYLTDVDLEQFLQKQSSKPSTCWTSVEADTFINLILKFIAFLLSSQL